MKPLAEKIEVSFAKMIPSGNPTILLFESEIAKTHLPSIALEVMSSNHLCAEQVGYLHFHQTEMPHLQMMGGEFCVNATRSAVALIAHLGKRIEFDSTSQYGTVDLTVSGYPSVVRNLLSRDEKTLLQKLSTSDTILSQYKKNIKEESFSQQSYVGESQLYVASCFNFSTSSIEKLDQGIFLVKLTGITHLLLDMDFHNLPQNWQAESEQWSSRYALDKNTAYGITWFKCEENEYSIYPAVFVSEVQSEHMETSCGSGSLAIALMLRTFKGKSGLIKINQLSGEKLSILFSSESTAWIAGNVIIAATGKTYVSV